MWRPFSISKRRCTDQVKQSVAQAIAADIAQGSNIFGSPAKRLKVGVQCRMKLVEIKVLAVLVATTRPKHSERSVLYRRIHFIIIILVYLYIMVCICRKCCDCGLFIVVRRGGVQSGEPMLTALPRRGWLRSWRASDSHLLGRSPAWRNLAERPPNAASSLR